MSCSRADLDRWLAEITGGTHDVARTGRAALCFDWGVLRIETEELQPRRIALLKARQLRVVFVPPEGREAEAREWITRFDRHTQRGGG
jgi:hypothetical protein